jgi:hypothetical protein
MNAVTPADYPFSSDEAGKEKRTAGLSFGVPMNSIPAASSVAARTGGPLESPA